MPRSLDPAVQLKLRSKWESHSIQAGYRKLQVIHQTRSQSPITATKRPSAVWVVTGKRDIGSLGAQPRSAVGG